MHVLRLGQNKLVVEVIQDAESHLSLLRKSGIHALRKSVGSQGQPKGDDRELISHSFEGESQVSGARAWWLAGWLNSWGRSFCWLLSLHHLGVTRSSCRAGALGQEVSHCLGWLLCGCDPFSEALDCRTKQASRGDRGFYPHPLSP